MLYGAGLIGDPCGTPLKMFSECFVVSPTVVTVIEDMRCSSWSARFCGSLVLMSMRSLSLGTLSYANLRSRTAAIFSPWWYRREIGRKFSGSVLSPFLWIRTIGVLSHIVGSALTLPQAPQRAVRNLAWSPGVPALPRLV
eukprot:IDg21411t1